MRAFEMSEEDRIDARQAYEILASFGDVTLTDAAQSYAEHHRRLTQSKTVQDAIADLLKTKEADGASFRYRKDLRNRLDRFAKTFGQRPIASISGPEVADWLRNLGLAPLTRNSFYLRISALFSHAVGQHWAKENPLSKNMRAKVIKSEPGILSLDQFSGLLEVAAEQTLPYWAIGGFAGVRSKELERLEWDDVDFEENFIEVDARNPRRPVAGTWRFYPRWRPGWHRTADEPAKSVRPVCESNWRPTGRRLVSVIGQPTHCGTAMPPIIWPRFRMPRNSPPSSAIRITTWSTNIIGSE